MIYLQLNGGAQTVPIPVSTAVAAPLPMTLRSTAGLEDVAAVASGPVTGGYLMAVLDPEALGLTPGEWEYDITGVASGVLAVVTDELPYRRIYDKNITYEQYRAE